MIVVDGSIMEGGGQILRNCMCYAALLHKALRIYNIRGKRSTPGLRLQHSKGIGLVHQIKGGRLEGNFVKSLSITYHPPSSNEKASYHSTYKVDIESAGSVALLVQTSLPLLLFDPFWDQCHLQCIGGTNGSFAPQIDWFMLVLQPMLKHLMDIDIDIQCQQRGFFPRGGGRVKLTTNRVTECIPAFNLTKRGRIKSIYGHVVVGGRAYSVQCGQMVAEGAAQELRACFGQNVDIDIEVLPKDQVDSYSDGIGVVVVAETTTHCLFGGSALHGAPARTGGRGGRGRRNRGHQRQQEEEAVDYGEIGRSAAKELITDWSSTKGGCTDRWLQDQLILFMALAKGRSRMATCALELHTETAIHVAELMTGVKFKVSNLKDGTVMIECEGMGYTVSGVEGKRKRKAVQSVEEKGNEDEVEEDQEDQEQEDDRRNYLLNRPSLF